MDADAGEADCSEGVAGSSSAAMRLRRWRPVVPWAAVRVVGRRVCAVQVPLPQSFTPLLADRDEHIRYELRLQEGAVHVVVVPHLGVHDDQAWKAQLCA